MVVFVQKAGLLLRRLIATALQVYLGKKSQGWRVRPACRGCCFSSEKKETTLLDVVLTDGSATNTLRQRRQYIYNVINNRSL